MDGQTYKFNSTAEVQLTSVLGFPGLRTPKLKLVGPTTIMRGDSTRPKPGRFQARTTIKELNLSGKILGAKVRVTLNGDYKSEGAIEGRADPKSKDPSGPDPIGRLKSFFKVYTIVETPFGKFYNDKPIEMRATIDSIPPDWARYRQYSPPRDLRDTVFRMIAAEMQCAVHTVKYVEGGPGRPQPKG